MLITAGPTWEPIDAVRFIGNRSSGRLGTALAAEAAARGWAVELLLGPTSVRPPAHRGITLRRFQTADELQQLLTDRAPEADVIIMSAAVADFRLRTPALKAKIPRGRPLVLELEPTPDLLAGLAAARRPGQFLVGFALQSREGFLAAAREKLVRKGADLIVANPFETMDSATIEAVVLAQDGTEHRKGGTEGAGGAMAKDQFARWLLDLIAEHRTAQATPAEGQGS